MKWTIKALIMKVISVLPASHKLYVMSQKQFGNLGVNANARSKQFAEIRHYILKNYKSFNGLRVFEVGTGHVPRIPIALFLSGAETVTTVDLHKRLDIQLLKLELNWISSNIEYYAKKHCLNVNDKEVCKRFEILKKNKDSPVLFLSESNINYLAPSDASNIENKDYKYDIHLSVTTLEHIMPNALLKILLESTKILKPNGILIHLIDPSDHFSHQDKSINPVNFLRYSKLKWNLIANNQFAYCNRLRPSEYRKIFEQAKLAIIEEKTIYDENAIGQKISYYHDDYKMFNKKDLAATTYRVVLACKKTR